MQVVQWVQTTVLVLLLAVVIYQTIRMYRINQELYKYKGHLEELKAEMSKLMQTILSELKNDQRHMLTQTITEFKHDYEQWMKDTAATWTQHWKSGMSKIMDCLDTYINMENKQISKWLEYATISGR
ncbi:hypothetical protein CathTA2_0751 [Caldalkalibacillus thermarum TA2.A1]|uniref:Uncharacterized protein n=1 Tax=Caldalkalibacillus thermarum (strain TA2.A1) TaxID=986075 RepID=F5L4N8_CALTT|nr:hypothetical protein [Caldalkalibacillus thermarum]EGL83704.1 hypothetical protein CathTA2_0751 [Caldalkalibacillus thermarum TA2.A1]QZT33950.1 hypothetical protein HUR95_00470 [Caldalkalibacillus thermarum TA2.A1]